MQDIYSALLTIIFVAVTAAVVGAFFLFLYKDQVRYRKEKIQEILSETGATEINIYQIEYPIGDWPNVYGIRPKPDIYYVEYKDAQGIRQKTKFLVSNINSDITWKGKA